MKIYISGVIALAEILKGRAEMYYDYAEPVVTSPIFSPRKHTKQTYRSQQRAAKARKKRRN
jgi:hypothetical protein